MMDKACRNILIIVLLVIVAIALFFCCLTQRVKTEEEQVFVPDTIIARHIECKHDTVLILKSELDTMIAQYNESIREIERKNSMRVEQKLEAVNTNISIWLAVIAAICTLLPMASAFYQTSLLDHKTKEIESKTTEYNNKIVKANDDIEKVNEEIKRSSKEMVNNTKREEFISSLSILESTIRILCEYQDLQNRNRLALADRTYLTALSNTIGNLSSLCMNYSRLHSQQLDNDQCELVRSSVLMALNSFSNFLIVLETIAPGECLIQVLSKRDELRNYIRQFTHCKTSGNTGRNHDLDSHIHYLGNFALQMMKLLRDCLPKE